MEKPKKITIEDVAKHSGCSKATVSRVINHDKRVRPETAGHIMKSIDILGYHPNTIARALSGGKTFEIAVVVPDNWKAQPYYIKLIDAIEDVADSKGYHIILKRRKYLDSVISLVNQKRIDGLIIRNMQVADQEESLFAKMERMGMPFILTGQPQGDYPFVKPDNIGGGRDVAFYFSEMAYKKILYISGPKDHIDSNERLAGFRVGLSENGFDLQNLYIASGDYSTESGYHASKRFFSSKFADAVFAANDRMALGALLYFREKGIKVPEEVSLAGYDDNFFSEFLSPSLTTVKLPMSEIGTIAMESLIRMIENKSRPNIKMLLPSRLVKRDSCISRL